MAGCKDTGELDTAGDTDRPLKPWPPPKPPWWGLAGETELGEWALTTLPPPSVKPLAPEAAVRAPPKDQLRPLVAACMCMCVCCCCCIWPPLLFAPPIAPASVEDDTPPAGAPPPPTNGTRLPKRVLTFVAVKFPAVAIGIAIPCCCC